MNPDPKQLLQIIHNRGEQAAVPAAVHDQARAAAQELAKWIDEQIPGSAQCGADAKKTVATTLKKA